METKQYAIKLPVDYRINLKKITQRQKKNEDTTVQNIWDAAKAALRGKFTTLQSFSQRTRTTSSKQPNLTSKTTRERKTNKI